MQTSRNEHCPCGSGLRFKNCCGNLSEKTPIKSVTPITYSNALPIDNSGDVASGGQLDRSSYSLTQKDISGAIREALEQHRDGRLSQAETIYREILQIEPNNPDALHLLGLVAHQIGRHDVAVELINSAINVNSANSFYHLNLAAALEAQDNLAAAAECLRNAILLNPDFAEAHNNLGNVLRSLGHLDDAVTSCRRALQIKPDYAEAYCNLGAALKNLGQFENALLSYQSALEIKADFAVAYLNLGAVLQEMGQFADAKASYQKALEIKPDFAEAHFNLGITLHALWQLDDAVSSFHHALEIKPNHAEAHGNLGSVLQGLGQIDNALTSFHKALEIKPDYAEAHLNLGNALLSQIKIEEAVWHYRTAISIKPDLAGAHTNLLFIHSYFTSLDPHEYLVQARNWEHVCLAAQDRLSAQSRTFSRIPLDGRRLKVGYVSGDFRQHAMSYFIEPLFTHHDRARVELFAYSNHGMRHAVTERLQALVDHWIPVVGMSDAAVRDRIEADGIDVLIDLSGHTEHNRLGVFARRAAPVQAHYLGYFASTGLTEIDYWIGDEILTPAETDGHFSEKVWRLPRVWLSYNTVAEAPEPDWCPASDGTVWLGSFNNLGKLTPQTLALWAKALHALPEGRLLLKTKELADTYNRQRILDVLGGHGIPSSRIELEGKSDWVDYMSQYNRLDIALDPVGGHGGGTITCDALWMGAPVIHALGDRATSRFAASMLHAIGHPEWIARSETEYVDKVVSLARSVELRRALRLAQRERMTCSPLCDAGGLALALENAYFEMYKGWLDLKTTKQRCPAPLPAMLTSH